MLLNEYSPEPRAAREDQEVIVKQMDMFFFGEGLGSAEGVCTTGENSTPWQAEPAHIVAWFLLRVPLCPPWSTA